MQTNLTRCPSLRFARAALGPAASLFQPKTKHWSRRVVCRRAPQIPYAPKGRGFGNMNHRGAPLQSSDKYAPKGRASPRETYERLLSDNQVTLVISTGPAGTGKTMMACDAGLEKISFDDYERMIITRPTIPVGGENLGYLPGTLEDKILPWVSHMIEYVDKYKLKSVMKKIEMLPLSYIRGRTFEDTWVLADEMQNSTVMQMKTLLTRIGANSKIVITGDLSQSDLDESENGLTDLLRRLKEDTSMHVTFSIDDVERSEFVKNMIMLYENPPIYPVENNDDISYFTYDAPHNTLNSG